MEPATRWFDWSFAPILTSDERFARQYRFRPPPGFLLASSCASIVHHLSGTIMFAPIRRPLRDAYKGGRDERTPRILFAFATPSGFLSLRLAYMLDSLVRVSRRAVGWPLAKISRGRATDPRGRASGTPAGLVRDRRELPPPATRPLRSRKRPQTPVVNLATRRRSRNAFPRRL